MFGELVEELAGDKAAERLQGACRRCRLFPVVDAPFVLASQGTAPERVRRGLQVVDVDVEFARRLSFRLRW